MKEIFIFLMIVLGYITSFAATKVCIDPGHGGSDPGAVGIYNSEKWPVLQIGLILRDYLVRISGVSVGMTRTGDSFPSLADRVAYANNNGYNRFISLHFNAYNKTSQGTETYCYTSGSTSSFSLRDKIHANLIPALGYPNRGVKTAAYYVLKYTSMPAALGEASFIDYNGTTWGNESQKLTDYNYRKKIAYAYCKGYCQHMGFGIPAY